MTEPTDNMVTLPVKYKKPLEGERFLVSVEPGKCGHWGGPFEIDPKGEKCTCKRCGEQVGPYWVLDQLMKAENRWMETLLRYQDEMKRLDERRKTKCRHCGQMTEISHR